MYYKILVIILSIFLIVSAFINLNFFSEKYTSAATIAGENLNKKEVQTVMEEKYWDKALDDTINNELIKIESANYKKPDEKELGKIEEFVKIARLSPLSNMNKKEEKEYLSNIYYIQEIAKKHTIKDDELRNYIKNAKEDLGENYYEIQVFTTDNHSKANKIESDLKHNIDIANIESKFDIQAEQKRIYGSEAYELNLSKLKPNQVVQGKEMLDEEMDHDSSLEKNEDASYIIVKLLEKKKIDDLEIRSDDIIEGYLIQEYYKELINVINYLRTKYEVAIK